MDLTVGAIDNWPEITVTTHPQLICVCNNYLPREEEISFWEPALQN